ncbi:MAG: response regulator [Limisphaerales bacterium]
MPKPAILIVEDEAIVAEDLAQKLGRLGYEIRGTTARGEAAVALARDLRPDLVLMDIRLQGAMDGVEAAARIRSECALPVIFLTAHSDQATLQRAKLTEPFGYILKPFEELELQTHIEMALYKHQVDQELRRQREWLRVTLTSIGDGVLATDAARRITFVNPVAADLTGWQEEQALGQPVESVFRIINEKTREQVEDVVAQVLRQNRVVGLANHTALIARDGREIPIEDSAAPIRDAGGKVSGVVLVFHDVTERRHARELMHSAALFPEENPCPVLRAERDGKLLFANRASAALLDEWHCSLGGCAPEYVRQRVARALETESSQGMEIVLGQRNLSFSLVPIPKRQYVNFYGMDVTERKRAEDQLRQTNEELTRFNNAAVGRELRMIELKKEVNALCAQAGQPPRYALESDETNHERPL